MYVLLSIIGAGILGFFLMMLTQEFFVFVAFAIITGCLFRIIYLLNKIDYTIHFQKKAPDKDKVKEAYIRYLNEKRRGRTK